MLKDGHEYSNIEAEDLSHQIQEEVKSIKINGKTSFIQNRNPLSTKMASPSKDSSRGGESPVESSGHFHKKHASMPPLQLTHLMPQQNISLDTGGSEENDNNELKRIFSKDSIYGTNNGT